MDQEEGPVNSQWSARDLRKIVGKSWPIHRQSGRPSFYPISANKDSSFLAHFSRSVIGMQKAPLMEYPYSRLWIRKSVALIPNDWSGIYGRSWEKRDQSAANPGGWLLNTAIIVILKKNLSPAKWLKPYGNFEFPRRREFSPNYRAIYFCVYGDFDPVFRFRGLLLTQPP